MLSCAIGQKGLLVCRSLSRYEDGNEEQSKVIQCRCREERRRKKGGELLVRGIVQKEEGKLISSSVLGTASKLSPMTVAFSGDKSPRTTAIA